MLTSDGVPVPGGTDPRENIRFDQLSADPDAPRTVYAPGSGIPFYGQRITRFLYIVTNRFHGGTASTSFWDTSALPPGDYTLRIWAVDFAGNAATENRDVPVTILTQEPMVAPQPGSFAIGNGLIPGSLPVDERGFPSVVNGRINIGAVSQAT